MSGSSEQFRQKSSPYWNISIFGGFLLERSKCVKLITGEKPWNDCNGYSSNIRRGWNETVQLMWVEMSLLHHKYLTCRLNNMQALSTCYLDLDGCKEEYVFQICTVFASTCRRILFYLLVHFPSLPKPGFILCWSSKVGKLCLLSLTNPQCESTKNTTLDLSLKGS